MVQLAPDAHTHRSFLPPRPSNPWQTATVLVNTPATPTTTPCPTVNTSDTVFNLSVETVCEILAEHRHRQVLGGSWQTAVIASYATLITVGIISNVLVCCVVARQSTRRAANLGGPSRNLYILNLAVADLTLCCVCMPLTLNSLIHFHWAMGVLLCKLAPVIQGRFQSFW